VLQALRIMLQPTPVSNFHVRTLAPRIHRRSANKVTRELYGRLAAEKGGLAIKRFVHYDCLCMFGMFCAVVPESRGHATALHGTAVSAMGPE
jgi:hypothetical protein